MVPPPLPLAALCLVLGCMIFPDGWDAETIRDMCGEKTGKYSLGDCSVRWAYILAIIGILNALILSFLAFVLGNRQNDLLHEELKTESKGEHHAAGGILGGNSLGDLAPLAGWQGSHGLNCHLQGKPGWAGWEGAAEPLPCLTSLSSVSTDFVGTAVSLECHCPVPCPFVVSLGVAVLGVCVTWMGWDGVGGPWLCGQQGWGQWGREAAETGVAGMGTGICLTHTSSTMVQ